jgi:hypothetical protein
VAEQAQSVKMVQAISQAQVALAQHPQLQDLL